MSRVDKRARASEIWEHGSGLYPPDDGKTADVVILAEDKPADIKLFWSDAGDWFLKQEPKPELVVHVLGESLKLDDALSGSEDMPPFHKLVVEPHAGWRERVVGHPTEILEFLVDTYDPDWENAAFVVKEFPYHLEEVHVRQSDAFEYVHVFGRPNNNYMFGEHFVRQLLRGEELQTFVRALHESVVVRFSLIASRTQLEVLTEEEIFILLRRIRCDEKLSVSGFYVRSQDSYDLDGALSRAERMSYLDVDKVRGASARFREIVRKYNERPPFSGSLVKPQAAGNCVVC
jgi:hypothetical protein